MKEQVNIKMGLGSAFDKSKLNLVKRDSFPYQGLWVWTGQQGSGKTLSMMHVLCEMHKEFPNAIIVSNISIYGIPSIPYEGIEDFDNYANGEDGVIFVIDEIQTLFCSLESAKMPIEQIAVWSQNRKNRRVILGTSQRFTRIAKPLREQVCLHYQCLPKIWNVHRYRVFDGSEYDENGNYTGEPQPTQFYFPRFDVMTKYNTLEVVRRKGVVRNE